MNRIVTGTLTLVLGIAIGWFAAPVEEAPPVNVHPSKPAPKSHLRTRGGSPSGDTANLTMKVTGPHANTVRRKLAEAGAILNAERRVLAVRTALADAEAADMEALGDDVGDLADRRPDIPLREEFLRRWGELEPLKALAYLGPDASLADRVLVLTAWGRTAPDEAAGSFQLPEMDLPDASRKEARALLAGIAEADAVKALRFADRLALADLDRLEFKPSSFPVNPSFRPAGSYQESVDSWIRQHPAEAFEVMLTLQSPKVREQALNELFHGWAYRDPQASQAAADRLWEHSQQQSDPAEPIIGPELMKTLSQEYGEVNGGEAFERAFSVEDPDLR